MLQSFQILGYIFPEKVKNATKIWNKDKVDLLLTQKWEEYIPKIFFVFQPLRFQHTCPSFLLLKFQYSKVNTICGVGQLLVSGC